MTPVPVGAVKLTFPVTVVALPTTYATDVGAAGFVKIENGVEGADLLPEFMAVNVIPYGVFEAKLEMVYSVGVPDPFPKFDMYVVLPAIVAIEKLILPVVSVMLVDAAPV